MNFKPLKRIFKFSIGSLTLLIVFLVLFLFVGLKMPFVQKQIGKIATNFLSKKLETDLSVGAVEINLFDRVALKDVYVEDLAKDTLASFSNLTLDIDLKKLLSQKIEADKLILDDAVVKLDQSEDLKFNFQFIIDAFAPKEKKEKVKKKSPWEINVKKVELNNLSTTLALNAGKQDIKFDHLFLDVNKLDLNTLTFDVDQIKLVKTSYIADLRRTTQPKPKTPIDPNLFPLQTLPITVNCKKLLIEDTYVDILTKETDIPKNQFNPQHIIASNLDLSFKNVVVDSTQASVEVNNISTELGNYFNINSLEGLLKFASNETSAQQLAIKTEKSNIGLNASLGYGIFGEFVKMKDELQVNLESKALEIHPNDINYFASFLNEYVNFKPLKDPKIYATANVNGTMGNLNIKQLDVKNGTTKLNLKGSVQNPTKIDNMGFQNVALTASTSSKEIKRFIGNSELPFDLSSFGKINLNTAISGKLNDLSVKQLAVKTDVSTMLDINGKVKNLTKTDLLSYDLEIKELKTAIADIQSVVPDLPEMLSNVSSISYTGKVKGTTTDFDLNGSLNTNLGEIAPQIKIAFKDNYTDAIYDGSININDFNIGKLLNDSTLGSATLVATLDGNGLSLDTINTNAEIVINSFTYNNYEYKDIAINGLLDKRKFTGDLNINDENIAVDFKGVVGFNDNTPEFDFEASIDTVNFHALNLMQDTLGLKLDVRSKLTGRTLNEMRGNIVLENIKLNNQDKLWETDSIKVVAQESKNQLNEILLQSTFINGKIEGDYEIDQLYASMMSTLDEYFPFSDLYKNPDTTGIAIESKPQQFDAEFYISDITDISEFFIKDLKEFDTASIILNLDTETKTVNLEVQAPKIVYGDIILENVLAKTNTDDGYLSTLVVADSIKVGNQISIPGMELNGAFADKLGSYSFYVLDEEGERSLGTKGKLSSNNQMVELSPNESFLLDGNLWNLGTQGEFKFGKGTFEFPSFNLIRDDQAILMRKNDKGDIKLLFESFEIGQIVNYVFDSTTQIHGAINGSLLIKSSAQPLLIDGDLFLAALEYNGIRIGNAMITFQNQGTTTSATLELSDKFTKVFADVNISEGNAIKGNLDLQEFDIKAVEPFVEDLISDAHGNLTGNLAVDGTINKPILNGSLNLKDVSTKVNAIGSYYTIQEGDLTFNDNEIKTNITFLDSLDRTAKLTGSVFHKHFSKFRFNLNFNTSGFTFLNAEKAPNIPIYGMLNAELDADITGNLAKPEVFAVFATIEDTDITIASITNKNKLSYESYVLFVDGKNYNSYQLDSLANELYKIDVSFDLTLYANINDNADIKVIIDPLSGDFLQVKGNGDLVVDIKESGALLVNGVYEVSSGQYRFSYQDLFLKWPFKIKQGSEILFAGDIMDANLDITAFYELQASTYGLVENEFETLSESEQKAAKALSKIEVLLNLGGQLKEPEVSFDIQFPEDNSTSVSSSVMRALDNVKSNETELNSQVFSLLLLQSFTTTNATSNLASAGTQVAFNSVSSFINSQLSKLTNKANGLEVGIGLASNSDLTDEATTTNTNINAFVRQSVLNDRLVIGLGGNVDLESGNASGGLTNVAGDFVLEYKITSAGNLRLSVFQKSDYDVLSQDNVWKSGVGFSYQKTFGRLIRNKAKQTKQKENEQDKKIKEEEKEIRKEEKEDKKDEKKNSDTEEKIDNKKAIITEEE